MLINCVQNPSVKSDCSGIRVGNSYCVQASQPPPSQPTTCPNPVPIQSGLISSCTTLYKAVSGDTCLGIVARFGTFTRAQFLSWNPAVGSDCVPGPKIDMYYCVGIPNTPNKPTSCDEPKPTSTTTTGNGIATPTPTQLNMANNCNTFYLVKEGETCQQIAAKSGISEAQFKTWNPSVGSSCSGIWPNAYACVKTIGFVPPVNLACSTTNYLWGDNRAAASSGVVQWCDGNSNTDGSGGFATGQTKYGCYNAPYGQNKIEFWARNDYGTGTSLSVQKCNDVMNIAVDKCDRGGEGTVESWYFKYVLPFFRHLSFENANVATLGPLSVLVDARFQTVYFREIIRGLFLVAIIIVFFGSPLLIILLNSHLIFQLLIIAKRSKVLIEQP